MSVINTTAQSTTYTKQISFKASNDTFYFDTSFVVAGSVKLLAADKELKEGIDFVVDYIAPYLLLVNPIIGQDLTLTWRAFPPFPDHVMFRKNKLLIESEFSTNPYSYNNSNDQNTDAFFYGSGLNVNGNLSRGLGFGNNQDLVLQSNLNLQLSGKLGKEIDILAVVSDDNNPIQPEGNTQQIQDFDKVYIMLSKDSTTLTMGDFLMTQGQGRYFAKFYKKSRGIQFNTISKLGETRLQTGAEIAVSRGRFARNEIQGVEGNQGPYRLSGANNEIFIIIISGTEVVYLDGEKLERGQNNDYVIDYNTGELTFMPKRLVTQFSRIVVEFQYSDRNYARSVYHLRSDVLKRKTLVSFNYFSEQDNRNQSIQQPLDLLDSLTGRTAREVLAESGDDKGKSVIPNVRRNNVFNSERINYIKKDSLGYDIYSYTTDPNVDTVFYELGFSFVGQGRGNYKPLNTPANGRVYQWVPPISGIPQGSYEPIIQLVSPIRKQLLTFGLRHVGSKGSSYSIEIAGSSNDKNTLSTLGKNDDQGWAAKLEWNNIQKWKKERTFISRFKLERANKNFSFIERYRDVEFERSWSRQLTNPGIERRQENELILQFTNELNYGKGLFLKNTIGTYNRGVEFKGIQDIVSAQWNRKRLMVYGLGEFLGSEQLINNLQIVNFYYKTNGKISYSFAKLLTGVDFTSESSRFLESQNDSVRDGSYAYSQYRVFAESQNTKNTTYKIEAFQRNDHAVRDANLAPFGLSRNINTGIQKQGEKWNDILGFQLSYREYKLNDTGITIQLPERTVLGRAEYAVDFLKRSFNLNTYYQIGTGQEQRREFTYLEVPAGQGVYAWVDYNSNGLKELNEFEISAFPDQARFIRVFIPTNEFIRSNTLEFNQLLTMKAPASWNGKKGIKKIVQKFSNVLSYKVDRKITDNSLKFILNPLEQNIDDTSLLSINSLLRNTLFFNRANPVFGAEYGIQLNKGKLFLSNGFDTRELIKNSVSFRWNLNKSWSFNNALEKGFRSYSSDFFSGRNFNFNFESVKPEVLWQAKKNIRSGVFYKYYKAENSPALGGETTVNKEFGVDVRYFVINKGNFDVRFSRIDIRYDGNPLSSLAYEMLSGYQNGVNYNWSMLFGGRIAKNIQITLNYEGRKSETASTVHIGRVEARYIF